MRKRSQQTATAATSAMMKPADRSAVEPGEQLGQSARSAATIFVIGSVAPARWTAGCGAR